MGREDIFTPTIGNERLRQDNNDSGVRKVNSATRTRCSRTETYISTPGPFLLERLTTKLITLIERRLHSSILGLRSFNGADCDTDHFLVVAIFRE